METISAVVFIPLMIIAVTQIIKMFVPKVKDQWTIIVALLVGIVVALLDKHIGIVDINVAQGLVLGLEAVGIVVGASKAGGGAKGDSTNPVAR
jgi:hypothetical protein